MSVPINISVNISRFSQGVKENVSISLSPLVHGPPATRHPLVHHALVVPDGGQAADGVQTVTVRVARPGHIDQS